MSSQNYPLITIGITAYNARDTVTRALDCALAQNWPNKEIIIVDDCSSDNTAFIIEAYILTHPFLKYFRQDQNQGVAAARNIILQNAKGDFVAFFDDDDVSSLDRLEKQYLRIQHYKYSKLAVCHCTRRQIYPDGSMRLEATPGCDETKEAPYGDVMFEKILLGKPMENGFGSMATCSLMMPRKVFQEIGLYDESFRRCEDTDFTLRLALKGGHFLGIEEPLVTQTMTSSSEKSLFDEQKHHLLIYRKYEDLLGKDKTDFCLRWLKLRYEFLHNRSFKFLLSFIYLLTKYPLLSIQKIFWVMPNIGFNLKFKKFHKGNP